MILLERDASRQAMEMTYQIDEDDFVNAGKLLLRTRRGARVRRIGIYSCWLILAACLTVLMFLRTFSTAAYFAVFLGLYTVLLSSIGWQYRRQYRKIPALHGPRTLEADENGLHLKSAVSDGRFSWQVLDRFAENDRTFVLVQQGGRIFFPVPKRQLTPEQIAGFRALCAKHINGS